jgi:formamidopyrimidine-DNA glycosylase
MIELPEAVTISAQMTEAVQGKRIESAVQGQSPHRFAFVTRTPEEYAEVLAGSLVGETNPHGSFILTSIGTEYVLALGEGGERILLHESMKTLPKKHQLLLRFEDGMYLTVSVQGWGSVQLLTWPEAEKHHYVGRRDASPLSSEFTVTYLQGLFDAVPAGDSRSIKKFVIGDPGIWGVGNGYLQDILFRARIHPRRRVAEISGEERIALYDAITGTLRQAVAQGGRDTERDLFNKKGGYVRILDSRTKGKPCRVCGTPIEKTQYLGGSVYFCPSCQTL